MKFEEINLRPQIISGLKRMKYIQMSEVQERAVPLIIDGSEVVVRSKTGSGKTAAFGIGMIQNILINKQTQGLILAPTRELAIQVSKELANIGRYAKIKVITIYGGVSIDRQIRQIQRGFDIIVGTPGRVLDHLNRETLDLSNAKQVVLDEADIMLDMGFSEDIDKILAHTSKEKQMMLFSATINKSIDSIIRKYLENPEYIEVGSVEVPEIEEKKMEMKKDEKITNLLNVLKEYRGVKTIVFVATKRSTEYICNILRKQGIHAQYIHGDKSQNQREGTMKAFKEGRFEVLVATDVAARGIHIDNVGLIINYDQANTKEMHRHRIGRTGRMGKKGIAITFDDGTVPMQFNRNGENRNNKNRRNFHSNPHSYRSRTYRRYNRHRRSGENQYRRSKSMFDNIGEKL